MSSSPHLRIYRKKVLRHFLAAASCIIFCLCVQFMNLSSTRYIFEKVFSYQTSIVERREFLSTSFLFQHLLFYFETHLPQKKWVRVCVTKRYTMNWSRIENGIHKSIALFHEYGLLCVHSKQYNSNIIFSDINKK